MAKRWLGLWVVANVKSEAEHPAPDGDLPSTLAFTLLFLLPAGAAFGVFELLRALPNDVAGDVGTFIGILVGPGVITALVSRWACKLARVEPVTAWSIIAAASMLAALFSFAALIAFGVFEVATSE